MTPMGEHILRCIYCEHEMEFVEEPIPDCPDCGHNDWQEAWR